MGDLEQYEVKMLRRDREIDEYETWETSVFGELVSAKFETLLSWRQFGVYCPRCGDWEQVIKASDKYYQKTCGHYMPRDVFDECVWDDELGWKYKG